MTYARRLLTESSGAVDAWNRLVAVYADDDQNPGQPGDLVSTSLYDGLNRRIQKVVEGDPDVTYDYYYSGYQVVEVRKDSDSDPMEQYVWDIRYVHAPVLRWRDTTNPPDGNVDETLYYCNDANFNVTALVETDGDVVERVTYDPYGKATFYDGSWANPSATSAYANDVLYTGHRLDNESGLYYAGARYYDPVLGRWISWDWIRYADALNLYEYVGANPAVRLDRIGLSAESCKKGTYKHTYREWVEEASLTVEMIPYLGSDHAVGSAVLETAGRLVETTASTIAASVLGDLSGSLATARTMMQWRGELEYRRRHGEWHFDCICVVEYGNGKWVWNTSPYYEYEELMDEKTQHQQFKADKKLLTQGGRPNVFGMSSNTLTGEPSFSDPSNAADLLEEQVLKPAKSFLKGLKKTLSRTDRNKEFRFIERKEDAAE